MRNTKIRALIQATTVAIIAVTAYFAGAGIIPAVFSITPEQKASAEPMPLEIQTVEARLVKTHTVEYVEETVIEKEYVDVLRPVPVQLRNFVSLEEMERWLDVESDGATLRFIDDKDVIDCDDYAFELQQKALGDGYIISFEIINATEYNELFSVMLPEEQTLHAINLAIIGNDVYYMEPQTGEIVHAACLD